MTHRISELRRSLRVLCRNPGFSIPALLCLTLTIGAATAVFSVVDAVLLRPLSYPDPDRLQLVYATLEQSGDDQYLMSPANTEVLAARASAFESVAASRTGTVGLTGEGEARQLTAAWVTPGFFRTLGARPLAGSGFATPARRGERVAYLAEGLWRREFGADEELIGRRILVDALPATVAGVVAADQVLPVDTEIWLPLLLEEIPADLLHSGGLSVVGRMVPGVHREELARQLEAVTAELRDRYPGNNRSRTIAAEPLHTTIVGDTGPFLLALLTAGVLLVALGCANVANLALVRNRRRRMAVATRAALGESRAAIVAWLAGETLILGVAAAGAGAGFAGLLGPALLRLTGISGPGIEASTLSPRTLAFVTLVSVATGLIAGILPALAASRSDLAGVLRGGRGTGSGAGPRRSSRGVLLAQAALGVVLVMAAGQTLGELRRLSTLDPGFRTRGLLTLRLQAPESRYPEQADFRRLFVEIRDAMAAVPGVRQVGSTTTLPIGDAGARFSLSVEDLPPENPDHVEVAKGRLVQAGYLEAMGIRLLAGRTIRPADTTDAQPVAVVSGAFARRYWPTEPAVGKRIKRRTYTSDFPWMTVVGVVEDVRDDGLDEPIGTTIYMPLGQVDTAIGRHASFVVLSDRPVEQLAGELRARIADVDPHLPVARVATMRELVDDSVATRRLAARLLGVFAAVGLVLLGAGTYGVVAFAVTERRAELGLRRALGADGRSLLALVLRRSLGHLLAGTLVGAAVAAVLSGLADDSLMPPPTPALYAVATGVLLAVGLVASLRPARRAVRLDPTISIREGTG